jgi:hypothetical protein
MPRKHRLALRTRIADQLIVVAPQTNLQQLPAEHLRERLAHQLALKRVEASTLGSGAQPLVQFTCAVFVHARRITAARIPDNEWRRIIPASILWARAAVHVVLMRGEC